MSIFSYVKIVRKDGGEGVYVFSGDVDSGVAAGHVAFSLPQRKWTQISLDREVHVFGFPAAQKQHIVGMTLVVDHFKALKEYVAFFIFTSVKGNLLQSCFVSTIKY